MECKDIKEFLEDFLEENIEEDKKAEINKHLDKCRACRKEYDLSKSAVNALKGIKAAEPPGDLWIKTRNRIIKKESRPVFSLYRPILVPAACMVIILFFFGGVLVNNYRRDNIMNSHLKECYSLMSAGSYDSALKLSQSLTSYSQDTSAEIMLIKGKCQEGMGRPEEALKTYREVAEKFPKSAFAAEVYYMNGMAFEENHDLLKASVEYMKVLDNFPPEKLWFFKDMALRLEACETILAQQEAMLAVRGSDNPEEKVHENNLRRIKELIEKMKIKEH